MKREILFKAKRLNCNEWLQGFFHYYGGVPVISPKHDLMTDIIDINTLCQFTGLLDKNGNKIFEGDLVTFKNFRGINGVVQSKYDGWIDGFKGFIAWSNIHGWELVKDNEHNDNLLKAKKSEKESRKCMLIISNMNITSSHPEIIGNIYD